jgi:RES domain-containing protein
VNRLPAGWRQSPAPPDLARFGDSFVEDGRTAILIVPSALAPAESNLLLNPPHKDFSKIRVASIEAFQYDSRFFS